MTPYEWFSLGMATVILVSVLAGMLLGFWLSARKQTRP